MLNRLNGWQRIGTVITGLWFAFVVALGVSSAIGSGPFGATVKATYKTIRTDVVCSKQTRQTLSARSPSASSETGDTLDEVQGIDECATGSKVLRPATQRVVQIVPERHVFFFKAFFVALLIPPIFFWLLSYASVAVFKWIAQGFHRGTS